MRTRTSRLDRPARRGLSLAVAAALSYAILLYATLASAQEFPGGRPIIIYAPFPPGGTSDAIIRIISNKVMENTGWKIVVETRVGAGGVVAAVAAKRAAADGYTLLLNNMGTHGVYSAAYSNLPFDPVRDFEPVSQLFTIPQVLIINANSPVQTVADLVKLAKDNPGKLNLATQGVASGSHLLGEMLKQQTGISFAMIHYTGGGPGMLDLIAGRVDFFFNAVAEAKANLGKVRVVANAGATRSVLFPDVPTMIEAGYPGIEFLFWAGLVAPASTPKPIIKRLSEEYVKAARDPAVVKRLNDLGSEVIANSPEEFAVAIVKEIEHFRPIVKGAGIKLD